MTTLASAIEMSSQRLAAPLTIRVPRGRPNAASKWSVSRPPSSHRVLPRGFGIGRRLRLFTDSSLDRHRDGEIAAHVRSATERISQKRRTTVRNRAGTAQPPGLPIMDVINGTVTMINHIPTKLKAA